MPQANKGNPSHGSRAPRRTFDLEQFIKLLVAGDRVGCRDFLREYIAEGYDSQQAFETLVWPACASIDQLSRKDQILPIHEHAAMMLLAQLVQRLECGLVKHPARCRQVIVTSGRSPSEDSQPRSSRASPKRTASTWSSSAGGSSRTTSSPRSAAASPTSWSVSQPRDQTRRGCAA